MGKKYKDIWLTESEIGDLLWQAWDDHFGNLDDENYRYVKEREVGINQGRVDFATFSRRKDFSGNLVELFELKITASVSSVVQLLTYKNDLDEVLRQTFYSSPPSDELHLRSPKVCMNLIARYFDSQILEICAGLDITLWRVNVVSKSKVDVELLYQDPFPKVYVPEELSKNLLKFYAKEREP